tara:strand:- start:37 stop:1668 length:1632 start_codon:yes stop_codon:yes gene_type:complete
MSGDDKSNKEKITRERNDTLNRYKKTFEKLDHSTRISNFKNGGGRESKLNVGGKYDGRRTPSGYDAPQAFNLSGCLQAVITSFFILWMIVTIWNWFWVSVSGKEVGGRASPSVTNTIEPIPASPSDANIIKYDFVVKSIQQHLRGLEYDPGVEDGFINNKTKKAIRIYQRAKGLQVDGNASSSLLSSLKSDFLLQKFECRNTYLDTVLNDNLNYNLCKTVAEQGSIVAQNNLGFLYENGKGVPINYRLAGNWYRSSAEQGYAVAQYNIGLLYEYGRGVSQSYELARYWYIDAAQQGMMEAQIKLGSMYALGNTAPQNYKQSFKWLEKAAEQGDATAQFNVGSMYAYGKGVTKNYKQAFKWFKKAADQGYLEAQIHLGMGYANGEGVEQDYKQAVKWYRRAAEKGSAVAQYNLGSMYDNGNGVSQDYKQVVHWYRKAAEQGHAPAQSSLGVSYASGQGIGRDYKKAIHWLRKGAEKKNGSSLYNLGVAYEEGLQDYLLAYMWFHIAFLEGVEGAEEARDLVREKVSLWQMLKGRKWAREWITNH